MTELGKAGKKMGDVHPRVSRKIDPVPLRATPKAVKRPKVKKPFGFKYQHRGYRFIRDGAGDSIQDGFSAWKWREYYCWYDTEGKRDQALKAWRNQHVTGYLRDLYGTAEPITRATSHSGDGE